VLKRQTRVSQPRLHWRTDESADLRDDLLGRKRRLMAGWASLQRLDEVSRPSPRLLIGGDAGAFTDPDGFVWGTPMD
jgi:hypothetical protein